MKTVPYSDDQARCDRCDEHGFAVAADEVVDGEHLCRECASVVRAEATTLLDRLVETAVTP